jgi:type III secretion system FlhB-like substrate exporter
MRGVASLPAGYEQGTPAQLGYGKAGRQQQQQRQQQLQHQRSGNQMPALIAKGSGQVAGAAAFAVAGAGKAIMPLFDKLATTLISDNPMLLEDLRWVYCGSRSRITIAAVFVEAAMVAAWKREEAGVSSYLLGRPVHGSPFSLLAMLLGYQAVKHAHIWMLSPLAAGAHRCRCRMLRCA